jgi:hypothetical protein
LETKTNNWYWWISYLTSNYQQCYKIHAIWISDMMTNSNCIDIQDIVPVHMELVHRDVWHNSPCKFIASIRGVMVHGTLDLNLKTMRPANLPPFLSHRPSKTSQKPHCLSYN